MRLPGASLEVTFAHTYLLLIGKLAAGGLLSLAVPPFFEVERGFFRSTAAVYLGLAWLMAAGEAYLFFAFAPGTPVTVAALAWWTTFACLFSAYVFTLFVDLPVARARSFPAAVFAGAIALGTTAAAYTPAQAGPAASVPYVAAMLAGAAIAGASVTGMLLGHWYLIETGLDLAPLQRILRYCRACLRAEVLVVTLGALGLYAMYGDLLAESFAAALSSRFSLLVVGRVSAWLLAALLLHLIARTLAIPQTMAATGLFYIEALVVAVGEILGHWLLFRTNLPL